MYIKTIPLGSFQANCYIIGAEYNMYVAVIDPGEQFELIQKSLIDDCKIPQLILLTHAHPDHYGALNDLKLAYPEATICMHKADLPLYDDYRLREMLGFDTITTPSIDRFINNGDVLCVDGGLQITVRHTPGHSPGCVCYSTSKMLFTGDTLFNGSVGRTDLPGGAFEELMGSIHNIVEDYPDEMKIYPGHGNPTSMLVEKYNNPYLK